MALLIRNMSAILRTMAAYLRNIIFEKYNESPEPNNSFYINKGNRDIVNLCISILIYFMEFKNQTDNKEEFVSQEFQSPQNSIYGSVRSVGDH